MSKSQEYRVMVMQKALGGAGVLAPGINSWTAAAEVLAHLDALASVGRALAAVPAHTPGALDVAAKRYRDAEWAIRLAQDEPVATPEHNARIDEWRAADAALAPLLGDRSPFEAASPSEETR